MKPIFLLSLSLVFFTVSCASLQEQKDDAQVKLQISKLKTGSFRDKMEALNILQRLYDERAEEPIIHALENDPDSLIRTNAAQALGTLRSKTAIPHLIAALDQHDEDVPFFAASALRHIGEVKPLLEGLKSDRSSIVHWSALTLAEMGDERAYKPLVVLLKNEDPIKRAAATKALGILGDARPIPLLIKMLKDSDAKVRSNAAESLGEFEDKSAVLPLIDLLNKDKDDEAKALAALSLGYLGDKRAVPPLLKQIKHPNVDVRDNVVIALGELKDKRAFLPLVGRLKDEEGVIRMRAVRSIGKFKDKRAIPILVQALENDFETTFGGDTDDIAEVFAEIGKTELLIPHLKNTKRDVRIAVVDALDLIGDKKTLPVLIDVVNKDKDDWVRNSAFNAITKFNDPRTFPLLLRLLNDKYEGIRRHASWAIGKLKDKRAIGPLTKILKERDEDNEFVRWGALDSLIILKGKEMCPTLIKILQDETANGNLRSDAATYLAQLNCKKGIEPLATFANHKDEYIKRHAMNALGKLGDKRAFYPLIEQLRSNQSAGNREEAAEALGQLGDKRAGDYLLKALNDESLRVQIQSMESLAQLDEKRAVVSIEDLLKRYKHEVHPSREQDLKNACERALIQLKKSPEAKRKQRKNIAVLSWDKKDTHFFLNGLPYPSTYEDLDKIIRKISDMPERSLVVIKYFGENHKIPGIWDKQRDKLYSLEEDKNFTIRSYNDTFFGIDFSPEDIDFIWWHEPDGNPRNLKEVTFYFNGENCGVGKKGVELVLDKFSDSKSKILIISGNLDDSASFGEGENPFESFDNPLNELVQKKKVILQAE